MVIMSFEFLACNCYYCDASFLYAYLVLMIILTDINQRIDQPQIVSHSIAVHHFRRCRQKNIQP
jgi:hypothetical protein